MNQSISLLALTVQLAGAVEAQRFVGVDGTQAGAGENTYGVSRYAGGIGDNVTVDVIGTATVEAGGALAAGAQVESDADGKAVTKTTGVAAGRVAPGASAAAEGDLVEIILIQN